MEVRRDSSITWFDKDDRYKIYCELVVSITVATFCCKRNEANNHCNGQGTAECVAMLQNTIVSTMKLIFTTDIIDQGTDRQTDRRKDTQMNSWQAGK